MHRATSREHVAPSRLKAVAGGWPGSDVPAERINQWRCYLADRADSSIVHTPEMYPVFADAGFRAYRPLRRKRE